MNVISKKALKAFWNTHPEVETSLANWYRTAKKANWNNLNETRTDFPHADRAGICTIFNIGGNKYRLVTKIFYPSKKVLIRSVLSHAKYDKKPYKDDCEC